MRIGSVFREHRLSHQLVSSASNLLHKHAHTEVTGAKTRVLHTTIRGLFPEIIRGTEGRNLGRVNIKAPSRMKQNEPGIHPEDDPQR